MTVYLVAGPESIRLCADMLSEYGVEAHAINDKTIRLKTAGDWHSAHFIRHPGHLYGTSRDYILFLIVGTGRDAERACEIERMCEARGHKVFVVDTPSARRESQRRRAEYAARMRKQADMEMAAKFYSELQKSGLAPPSSIAEPIVKAAMENMMKVAAERAKKE